MLKYSLEILNAKGLEIAKSEQKTKLIASTDGQFFTEENISYAKMHARTTKGVELHEIEYSQDELSSEAVKTESAPVKKSAAEKIAEIAAQKTVVDVENYIKGESLKTVLAAAEIKKVELKKAEETADTAAGRN